MPKRKAACTAKASANVQAPNKKQFTLAQARKLILDSESNSDSADNLETESDSNVDDSDHESHTDRASTSTSNVAPGSWIRNVTVNNSTFRPSEPTGPRGAAA